MASGMVLVSIVVFVQAPELEKAQPLDHSGRTDA
jgi:hypothetical protein